VVFSSPPRTGYSCRRDPEFFGSEPFFFLFSSLSRFRTLKRNPLSNPPSPFCSHTSRLRNETGSFGERRGEAPRPSVSGDSSSGSGFSFVFSDARPLCDPYGLAHFHSVFSILFQILSSCLLPFLHFGYRLHPSINLRIAVVPFTYLFLS